MITDGLPDIGDMMKQISENPQAREMLLSLIGPSDEETPENPGIAPMKEDAVEASVHPGRQHGVGRHRALLCALRPYLGERRAATLSRMERALEIYELIEQMKHTKGGI